MPAGPGGGAVTPRGDAQRTPDRLTRRVQFKAVAADGRKHHGSCLTLQARSRSSDEALTGLRAGITVTRKVGHAVERNRIRRRFREVLRALPDDSRSLNADIVLIARRAALTAPYDALRAEIERGLARVRKTMQDPSGPDTKSGPRPISRERTAQVR